MCLPCFACVQTRDRRPRPRSLWSLRPVERVTYFLFAQKPRTSCPKLTSAAFVRRGSASFCCRLFVFASLPSRAELLPLCPKERKKKKIIVNVLGHLKKPVAFCFCALCSVFTSCLRAAHFDLTEPCVPRSSVAVLDEFFVVFFRSCLQLFLHIFALKCTCRGCCCLT